MKTIYLFLTGFVLLGLFNSCENEDTRPEPASLQFQVQNVSAFNGSDGAISVTIEGGEEPFYYFWSNGARTKDISGLLAGSYTLRVSYGENGIAVLEGVAQVEQPAAEPLSITGTVTNSPMYDRPLGEIDITGINGVGPFTYLWSNGATTASISDLYAGTYSVIVEDSSSPSKRKGTQTFVVGEADFVCGVDSIRDVEGNRYATVELAGMCWTVDNLRTQANPADSSLLIEGRYCRLDYCETSRGAHYVWASMLNGQASATDDNPEVQGIAPQGWHIPTKTEWLALQAWLAVDGNGGSGTNAYLKVMGEASSSGFNVLATGNWGYGIFSDPNIAAFWTANENIANASEAEIVYMIENASSVATRRFNYAQRPKNYGLSIRLVKNAN
jgi:uncharacterized protein (TIGR02145 family)